MLSVSTATSVKAPYPPVNITDAQKAAMTPEELSAVERTVDQLSIAAAAYAADTGPPRPGRYGTLVTRNFVSSGKSQAPKIDPFQLQKTKTVETHAANYTNVQSIDPSSLADQISIFADMVAQNKFQGMSFSGGNGTEQTDSPNVYLNWMKAAQAADVAGQNFTTYA